MKDWLKYRVWKLFALDPHIFIWKFFGRRFFKITEKTVLDDEYDYMAEDDRIDMKSWASEHGDKYFKYYYKLFKKRRNWYIRHGFFELADDIQTAIWVRGK